MKASPVADDTIIRRAKRYLINYPCLRKPVQAIHVAASLRQPLQYLRDVVINARTGVYTSKRTGEIIALRPRSDLQVAREHVSKDNYTAPPEIRGRIMDQAIKVLDLGANIGLFTLFALRRMPSCRVIAVEPDSENLGLLRRNISSNAHSGRVRIIEGAVGTENGWTRFAAGSCEMSRLATDNEQEANVVEIPLLDFYELAAGMDFVKIDIEGGEWPILRDPRLANLQARVVAMEWHTHSCHSSYPELEVKNLLRRAGYEVLAEPPLGKDVGFVWAWRE
jgi:FkbM family methyltransferase